MVDIIIDKTKAQKLLESAPTNLFQSSAWLRFQDTLPGRHAGPTFVIKDNGNIVAFASLVIHKLPFGQYYAYLNKGPVCTDTRDDDNVADLLEAMITWCASQRILFLRAALPWEQTSFDTAGLLLRFKTHTSPTQHQPVHSIVLDLNRTNEELLADMKPKGRYNIKVASKHGVQIRETDDVHAFYELLRKTTTRDNFSGHDEAYYREFLSQLAPSAKLYLAYYDDKPIAGIINTYHNKAAIYYYGVSDNEHRNVMAPYALQWYAIQDARELGCTSYDLFGIAPPDEPHHPWAGITSFKEKFGGTHTVFHPTIDIPVRPWLYAMYASAYRLRAITKKI